MNKILLKRAFFLLFLILITFTCFGCASGTKYMQIMQTTIGMTENELISSWRRIPDKVYVSDELKFLTWIDTYSHGGYCETSFAFQDGKVIYFQPSGNYCVR